MDVNDISSASPLRGLLSSPARRATPAVPVPDWRNEPLYAPISASTSSASDQIDTPVSLQSAIQRNTKDDNMPETNICHGREPSSQAAPVRSDLRDEISTAASQTTPVITFVPTQKGTTHTPYVPHTPQPRVSSDVPLTPTSSMTPAHAQNPHATMAALTPMASGPAQAKNSIKLQNCVSTVSVGCELKLLDIYCRTRFSEYNPSRFHGVVMKIMEPRATALIFRSGKIVCTGARNEHDSYTAARKFARIIQKLGFPAKFLGFKIQNFIATADLRFPVRLEALQQAHGQFTSYEPELFPGLVYRMVRPRIVLLIFVNGKIVFTGGKTRNDISEALEIMYPILHSFRKN